jgi:hypothetical protein
MVHIHAGILYNHKKDELLSFVSACEELEITMLNEISQAQKDKYCMISFVDGRKKFWCSVAQ